MPLWLVAGNNVADRVVPHLAADSGGFKSVIHLYNPARQEKTVSLMPYAANGSVLTPLSLTLKPAETKSYEASQLLPGASHFFVQGSVRVQVAVSFQANDEVGAASYLSEQRVGSRAYLVYPSKSDLPTIWEGFAVVNAGVSSANVSVTQMNDQGIVLDQMTFVLASGAKRIWMSRDFFEQSLKTGAMRISADQPIALMSLVGVTGGPELWNVVPVQSPEYDPLGFSNLPPQELQKDPFVLLDAAISEELLHVDLEFSTQCAYRTSLTMSGGFMESLPVQVNLVLSYEILPGHCARQYEYPRETFDLTPLAESYRLAYGEDGTITLNLFDAEGYVKSISYDPY